MENAQVIHLKAGQFINVDQTVVGYRIDGPATIFVIKDEAAAETATSQETLSAQYNATER